jgi:hypothetical protein
MERIYLYKFRLITSNFSSCRLCGAQDNLLDVKVKVIPYHGTEGQRGDRNRFPLGFNFGVGWWWVVSSTTLPLLPSERQIVPIVNEVWWASGLVWKDLEQRKFLAHAGVWTADLPARSYTVYIFPASRLPRNEKNATRTDLAQSKSL